MTATYRIDPLTDPRWGQFIEKHPRASVFHTPGWLEALRRSYGYVPMAYTTAPPGETITNGIAVSRVDSRITGRRLISLPFSDHCEPLLERPDDLERLLGALKLDCERQKCKYLELRPHTASIPQGADFQFTLTFSLHTVDLTPSLGHIFGRFHKSCVQRKIQRAERERLTYEEGQSQSLLDKFQGLLLLTRRRQQLPPHPRIWFRNLMATLGERAKIRIASKDGRPIAGMLTLSYRDVLTFKYGCSDDAYHQLGGVQLLFWNAIQDAKQTGARTFDLGRSALDNPGLMTFKSRWGATQTELAYWRYPPRPASGAITGWQLQLAKALFGRIPDRLLTAVGRLFYRHIG